VKRGEGLRFAACVGCQKEGCGVLIKGVAK